MDVSEKNNEEEMALACSLEEYCNDCANVNENIKRVTFQEITSLEDKVETNVLHTIATQPMKTPTIKIEATIDSGASHSVAPPEAVPNVPIHESAGSRRGQHYVAAGGETIPNVGEQVIKFSTSEGKKASLKWQCAPISKPLVSVGNICDAGHEITCNKDGGRIVDLKSGVVTKFRRQRNVYVMDMITNTNTTNGTGDTTQPGASATNSGFTRQGPW